MWWKHKTRSYSTYRGKEICKLLHMMDSNCHRKTQIPAKERRIAPRGPFMCKFLYLYLLFYMSIMPQLWYLSHVKALGVAGMLHANIQIPSYDKSSTGQHELRRWSCVTDRGTECLPATLYQFENANTSDQAANTVNVALKRSLKIYVLIVSVVDNA